MKIFDGLLSILEEETRCYERICKLKEEEQQLILSGRPDALARNTTEIDSLSQTVHTLESARLDIMESIAKQFDLPSSNIDFHQVVQLADENTSTQLQEIMPRLVEVIQRTSELNRSNAHLIRRSLDHIEGWLSILTRLSGNNGLYGDNGRMGQQATTSCLMNQRA